MVDQTPNYGIRYPESTDDVRLWEHMQTLASDTDDALTAADLLSLAGSWTAYTPTISGGSSVGNGTLTGRWRRVGKTVDVCVLLTRGSSTTFGGSFISFSLPSGITALDLAHAGGARLNDAGTNSFAASCIISDDHTAIVPLSTSGVITATVPFTWATGDVITAQITFETA